MSTYIELDTDAANDDGSEQDEFLKNTMDREKYRLYTERRRRIEEALENARMRDELGISDENFYC